VLRAQPCHGEPGVFGLPARLDRVQVAEVGGDPPPEVSRVPHVAVTRHHDADAGQRRQRAEPVPVIPERVRRLPVKQRYLDV
jgi:hypothetical protein